MISINQKIVPHLWFDNEAKEAVEFYCEIFPNSEILSSTIIKDTPAGDCFSVNFLLDGQKFSAISAGPFFKFNEAISFMIMCDTQGEIDYYWEKLSAVPEYEQCGWIKDKFGISWQIVPSVLDDFLNSNDTNKVKNVTKAFLKMKKMDIEQLEKAYNE